MQKLLFVTCIAILFLASSCGRTGLKKYYKAISSEEFASYDSVTLKVKSKYGNIYHASEYFGPEISDGFLVFEKVVNGKRQRLFRMDTYTELKNDSTFIFYGEPISTDNDSLKKIEGCWFCTRNAGGTTYFSADSTPTPKPTVDYHTLTMGIYLYRDGRLVKISGKQSEDALEELAPKGFIYLPPPGRFFVTATFSQIQ